MSATKPRDQKAQLILGEHRCSVGAMDSEPSGTHTGTHMQHVRDQRQHNDVRTIRRSRQLAMQTHRETQRRLHHTSGWGGGLPNCHIESILLTAAYVESRLEVTTPRAGLPGAPPIRCQAHPQQRYRCSHRRSTREAGVHHTSVCDDAFVLSAMVIVTRAKTSRTHDHKGHRGRELCSSQKSQESRKLLAAAFVVGAKKTKALATTLAFHPPQSGLPEHKLHKKNGRERVRARVEIVVA